MRRIIQATLAIICLLPAGLRAQENKMSLNDCIEYALAHQAKMKNAILDKKTSIAKNREVTGLALPQLKATGSINYAPLVAAFEIPNFIKYTVAGYPGVQNSGLVKTNSLNSSVVDDPATNN
ncbi:MAG: hypothetical protein ACTHKV_02030, partial [Flavipsychrobacter sp.]